MLKPIRNYIARLRRIRTKWPLILLSMLILGALIFFAAINNVSTKTYDIERFSIAKETIRSPITVENEAETERKMLDTIQSVEDRYFVSEDVTEERMTYVKEIFAAIATLEKETDKENAKESSENERDPSKGLEKIERLKQILSDDITDNVTDDTLILMIETSPKERKQGEESFIKILSDTLEEGVRAQTIQTTINEVKQHIKYANLSSNMTQALSSLSEFAITENAFYDADKTMEARKDAANSVDPEVIRAGEIIVREGQRITNEKYEHLQLAGLLSEDRQLFPAVGLVLFIILILGVIMYEMVRINKQGNLNKGVIVSVLIASVITIALMKVISLYTTEINQLFYIVPAATGVLLIKQLVHERFAIVMAILYAIIGSILFNAGIPGSLNFEAGVYMLFTQLGAIISIGNKKERLSMMYSGIWMALINVVTIILFLFLSFEKYAWTDLLLQSGYGVASAFLSIVLTLGLMPFFETSLGILTDMKLLSLATPNQPLIRKMLMEAPGTYHHSVMVANLSEAAAEAIGAHGLLARVGAYYHDVGKTVRPPFFIENQMTPENPHDQLDPKESADIIIAHPYDGVKILKQHHIPREIVAIANEHHGTTLLKYFYYKAKQTNESVQESQFRYPGPKPQTKESAIVSVCDAVEAAVRSMNEPTEQKIEALVLSIVNDRFKDGQFDECSLTMKEMNIVRLAICETLNGMFHSRIQYPMEEAK